MAFERAFITLTLAVDLDGVPGMCDKPEDFVTILNQALKGAAHYKPEITVKDTVVKKYKWDEQTSEYVQPTLEGNLKPKAGDCFYNQKIEIMGHISQIYTHFYKGIEVVDIEYPGTDYGTEIYKIEKIEYHKGDANFDTCFTCNDKYYYGE